MTVRLVNLLYLYGKFSNFQGSSLVRTFFGIPTSFLNYLLWFLIGFYKFWYDKDLLFHHLLSHIHQQGLLTVFGGFGVLLIYLFYSEFLIRFLQFILLSNPFILIFTMWTDPQLLCQCKRLFVTVTKSDNQP